MENKISLYRNEEEMVDRRPTDALMVDLKKGINESMPTTRISTRYATVKNTGFTK